MVEFGEDERLAKIEDFVDTRARSPQTKEFADSMRRATAVDRGKLLRDTAVRMDVFSCEVAKILESPQIAPKVGGPPTVRVRAPLQIVGVLPEEDLAKAIAATTPAMVDCYEKGLEKKPDLAGTVAIKLQIDPAGNVMKDAAAGATFDDQPTVECVLVAMRGLKLPKNQGPLVTALVPLELASGARE